MREEPTPTGAARVKGLVASMCLGLGVISCDSWAQSTPRLQRSLDFPVRLPSVGEPTKIMGSSRMICASRHLADTACFGELLLSMHPVDLTFGEYPFKYFHTRPLSLRGIRMRTLSADRRNRCLIDDAGELRCWGDNFHPGPGHIAVPWKIPALSRAVDVSRMFAVGEDGNVHRWGYHACEAGNFDNVRWSYGEIIEGIDDVVDVSIGHAASCALTRSGEVHCLIPPRRGSAGCSAGVWERVEGLEPVVQVQAGQSAACALDETGQVWCWGKSATGLLGPQSTDPGTRMGPVPLDPLHDVVKLAVFESSACALRQNGDVWCWGWLMAPRQPPTRMQNVQHAIDIMVGHAFGCAILADRQVRCFGPDMDPETAVYEGEFQGKEGWVHAPVVELR